jgi:Rv0078B-related antitoxin
MNQEAVPSKHLSIYRMRLVDDPYPLEIVDEMFDLGVEMRRERARRDFPDLDEAAIEEVVDAWLLALPAAPFGDSAGTVAAWPRR